MTKKELNIHITEEGDRVVFIIKRHEQGELKETLNYDFGANEPAIAVLLITLITTSVNKQK